MSPRNADRHEPDDPDITRAMRARREELGLSVSQMSKRAGVSAQTWRSYEAGRSRVRADKQDSVWDALGWEPPSPWSALRAMTGTRRGGSEQRPRQSKSGRSRPDPGPLGLIDEMDDEGFVIDDDIEDAVKALLDPSGRLDELVQEDAEALHLPGWDEIPTGLATGCSPRLAGMLGQGAARCFAPGAFLYDRSPAEDLDSSGELPRGPRPGELEDTRIAATLSNLWLIRYDCELVFRMRRAARLPCLRLTGEEELADPFPFAPDWGAHAPPASDDGAVVGLVRLCTAAGFSGAWRRRRRRGAGGSPGVRASGRCAPSRRTPPPGPPTRRRR